MPSGITASVYNPATGILTLSGTASLADYQTAIRAITFAAGGGDAPVTTSRTIDVTVNDGSGNSNTARSTITIVAVNDAPTANIVPATYSATEQTALNLAGTGLSIADVDSGSGTVRAILSVSSGVINATLGVTGASIVSGNGTATLTVSGTLAQINNLLAGNNGSTLTYINNSDNPPATATLTLTASDLGNAGTGGMLTGSDTATINITPVNDAPVLATGSTLNYVENLTGRAINGSITVADPDNATLSTATVRISANFQAGQDVLAFTNTNSTAYGNIAATYDAGTGALTLVSAGGTATVAQWQAALRAVTYANTSDNPSTLARTVTYQIDDGQPLNHTSNTISSTVNVAAVNDAPVLDLDASGAGTGYATVFNLNTGAAIPVGDIDVSITDVDSTIISGATITISAASRQAGDFLAAGPLPAGISASTYNATTGVLTLSGSASLADYQAAIRAVSFDSNSTSTATRTITVTVTDGSATSAAASTSVTILGSGDRPVIDLDANDSSGATGTGYRATFSENGAAVSIADGDVLITDSNSANLTGATITLTNAQRVTCCRGTLPGGITASAHNPTTGRDHPERVGVPRRLPDGDQCHHLRQHQRHAEHRGAVDQCHGERWWRQSVIRRRARSMSWR